MSSVAPISTLPMPTETTGSTVDEVGRSQPICFFQLSLVLSAVFLGNAIHIRDGEYWPLAITLVGLSIISCLIAFGARWIRPTRWGSQLLLAGLFGALVIQFGLLLTDSPGGSNWWSNDLADTSIGNFRVYEIGIRVAFLVVLLGLWKFRTWGKWMLLPLLAIHLGLGIWMIRSSPRPQIDVFVFQQVGAEALRKGDNPYAITYPDIYRETRQGDAPVYGKGLMKDGKLSFGFPYTPASLILSTIGYLFAGDHRYAQAVAFTLAGALIALARPSRVSLLAAAGLLFTPRAFFILGRAWTEPFVILGLASAIFIACRLRPSRSIDTDAAVPLWRWIALTIAIGFFWSTKQYLLIVAPLTLLLMPPRRPFAHAALVVAGGLLVLGMLTLPLALRDWQAFFHSTVSVQGEAPFRKDALSFLVLRFQQTGVEHGVVPAFLTAIGALALALWRAPRNPAGYAAGVALVFLLLISLNKQAFANYYLLPIAAAWAAVACAGWAEVGRALPAVPPNNA